MANANLDKLTENKSGGRKYYHQLLALQDDLFLRAMKEQEDNGKAASCARAWEVLEERKRIMRGKLKPGSINARDDSAAGPRKRQQRDKSPAPAQPIVYPPPGEDSAPSVMNEGPAIDPPDTT